MLARAVSDAGAAGGLDPFAQRVGPRLRVGLGPERPGVHLYPADDRLLAAMSNYSNGRWYFSIADASTTPLLA